MHLTTVIGGKNIYSTECNEIARLKRQRLVLATLLRHATAMARAQIFQRFLMNGVPQDTALMVARDTVAGDLSEEMLEEDL
jgi:hypothetical protein